MPLRWRRLARELGARFAVVADPAPMANSRTRLPATGIEAAAGEEALIEAAQRPADWVMAAISGAVGLKPTLAAVERGATVALANKECLVCAGACSCGARAAPAQPCCRSIPNTTRCSRRLAPGRREDVRRIDPDRVGRAVPDLVARGDRKAATPEQALRHPNWSMGPKVTIDSATHDEQGSRTDRGASSVRARAGRDRRAGASAVDRARPGRIPRRLGGRAARLARHAHPDRALPGLAERIDGAGGAARSCQGART